MKKLLVLSTVVGSILAAMSLTSCGCCTAKEEVPPLRPLPNFAPISVEVAK